LVEETKEEKPFGLIKLKIIEDFFHAHFNYVTELADKITIRNEYYPTCCINLKEIMLFNDKILGYIIKNPTEAVADFQDTLYKRVIERIGEEKVLGIPVTTTSSRNFHKIHITFDYEDVKGLIPIYENFSLGTKPFLDKLVLIRARFLDLQIFREDIAELITYECLVCGDTFEIVQRKGLRGKYKVPKFCLNKRCKAKGWGDFIVKEVQEYSEVGSFRIGELDFSKQIDKQCYTFFNYDYFAKKTENINLNDVIELIGIIKHDLSDIGTRKENQKIEEFIEIIDFKPIELKKTDESLIKELRKDFTKDSNYHIKILDSIHPLTRGVYTYRIFKIIQTLGIISADSWDSFFPDRCSINNMNGSVPGNLKTSIVKEFRKIMGINEVGRLSGQSNTAEAFVPTSQRGKEAQFVIRYGAFAYHNKKYLPIDEFQYMLKNPVLLYKSIKYLEDGIIDKGSDGTVLRAECKLSVGAMLNYLANSEDDEGYDYKKSLRENLNNVENSVLQRFDLHYAMNSLSTDIQDVVEKRIFEYARMKREMKKKGTYKKGESFVQVGEIEVNKIYNWIQEAKRLYAEQEFSVDMENTLRAYVNTLRLARGTKTRNIREFRTLVKLVCGISAMRLKTEVDITDLEYVQEHLVDKIIPFFESRKIRLLRLEKLNLTELYRDTIKLLTELKQNISIVDVIKNMRNIIESHFLPDNKNGNLDILNNTIEQKLNAGNQQFRKLHEDNDNIEWLNSIGYIHVKYKNTNHYAEKTWLKTLIYEEIKGIFAYNKNKPLERKGIIQVLKTDEDTNFDEDTLNSIIDSLIESKLLENHKENNLKLL